MEDNDDVVDPRNILPAGSRRKRKAPVRYVDENYAALMLEDVPEDEIDDALSGDCSDAVIESESEEYDEAGCDDFIENDASDDECSAIECGWVGPNCGALMRSKFDSDSDDYDE